MRSLSLFQNYKNTKTNLLKVGTLVTTFIVTVILPLIFYLQALNMQLGPDIDINSYLARLESNTIQTIIIGILITILLSITYLLNPFSGYKLSLSILIKFFYIGYIIIVSSSEIFEIGLGNLYLKVDLSALNLFILPVPVLFIARTILRYIYNRKEHLSTLIILDAIVINDVNSKTKIRKLIAGNGDINKNLKSYLLKNFNTIIDSLESRSNYPLIVKIKNRYRATKAGQDYLARYGYTNLNKDQQLGNFQVWTESDLEKLARERAKDKKINFI